MGLTTLYKFAFKNTREVSQKICQVLLWVNLLNLQIGVGYHKVGPPDLSFSLLVKFKILLYKGLEKFLTSPGLRGSKDSV